MVEVGRRQRRDPARQLEGARMAELEGRREVELGRLRLDRLDDRIAVVAGVGAPQPGGAVEDRAALRRVVVHVLGARDQPRPRLEGAVGGERHQEGFEVVRHRRGDGAFCAACLGHGPPRCLDRPKDYPLSRIMTKEGVAATTRAHVQTDLLERMADKSNKLKARLPRGLADRGPAEIAATRRMIETIRAVYERYGFEPVETPAIEYTDALGKFLPDQDRPNEGVFSFQDDDEQWLSLRYDLTAPLARYVAENFDALPKPYRSYRFGWVFRNEKPGPGRFRQFMQFDADTVGAASMAADAEICMMAADTMEALGIPRGSYVVKVNNRKVLDGVMEAIGIGGEENAGKRLTVLRAIDKLDRLGREGVEATCSAQAARTRAAISPKARDLNDAANRRRVLAFVAAIEEGADAEANTARIDLRKTVARIESDNGARSRRCTNFARIAKLRTSMRVMVDDRIRIDPSVVRGLEYYTGPVYEVELLLETKDEKGRPVRFGSVGGGGRYDGLVSRFRGEPVPATGFSIGVSRLQAALTLLGKLDNKPEPGPVVVTVFDRDRIADYQKHGGDAARRRHPRRTLSRQSGKVRPADEIRRQAQQPLRVIQGGDEKAERRSADQGPDPGRDAHRHQGPRRISEEAGRGAVRGAGGQAGRCGAPGAGAPRRGVGLATARSRGRDFGRILFISCAMNSTEAEQSLSAGHCLSVQIKNYSKGGFP